MMRRIPLRQAVWLAALAAQCVLLGSRAEGAAPSLTEARTFIEDAERQLMPLVVEAGRADWVRATYITDDTELLAAEANKRWMAAAAQLALDSRRFDGLELPPELARRFKLLKIALTIPPPADPEQRTELTRIMAQMEGVYGKGKWCHKGPDGAERCDDLNVLGRTMRESRNEKELLAAWSGWHSIAPPLKKDFGRYVELGNAGARQLGFSDVGALWRSKYDMPPDAFEREVERLWEQVKPLYLSLHTYVRWRLREVYGADVVPASGPIPAHLLGNMWAQEWGNIYPLVAPKGPTSGIDLTAGLKAKGVDERGMVRYGERFFMSLGLDPLPPTFWERSLFTKPSDREVVCHASAWDIDYKDDVRIKMCIEITGEDFRTIHHELGHNYYQRAYSHLPFLFQDSANDGFHEALGDTLDLSVTPSYLKQLSLIAAEPDASQDIGLLLQMALDKVAFLPFGLMIDQWRWKVFAGQVRPENYNAAWWQLRTKYQGVAAPVARSEADFDPGAKYHIPASVPYTRYFLARILQFQFHRALCRAAGQTGPLHRQSIYNNAEAGRRLKAMMEMGMSRPWPDALEALTGERQIDATAILDYFAPLKKWLDEQNKGKPSGW